MQRARAATVSRDATCNLAASEWLREKHDVFDKDRGPNAEEVQSRLEMLLGASKDAAGPERAVRHKTHNPPTFAEIREIGDSLRALLPSLQGINTLEVNEQKANGRLMRLEPSSGALYIHPDIFKSGIAEGTATVHAVMLASSFAATLTGTAGQGAWATYHCLPSLILQTSKDPLAHIKHVARTFASLESQGWDVAPLASYWREVSSDTRKEHAIGASSGALSPWAPVFSPGAERSFALQSDKVRLSDGLMARLQELTGKSAAEIDTLLINYNIYKSQENPFISKGFVVKGETYIGPFLKRCDLPPEEHRDLASAIFTEGMNSVSSPLRRYVGRISGESQNLLSEVDNLHGAWPTKREQAEFLRHSLGKKIDPDLKGLMLFAHRSWRNVALSDLLALHPGNELVEYSKQVRSQTTLNPFAPSEPIGKAYQAIPAALRFLGREGCNSLVAEFSPTERFAALGYMTCLPRYHEGLVPPFKEDAQLFEETFTGRLTKDLSEVASSRPVVDRYLKKLIPPATGVFNTIHPPPTEGYWKGLERFGFLVTDTAALVEPYGTRAKSAVTRSALTALSTSSDPMVRTCAYNALTTYGVDINQTATLARAFTELSHAPAAVADRATFSSLEAAARFLAVRTIGKDLEWFFSLCDQKRSEGAVADYLVGALSAAFISRGDGRALKELITSDGKSSAITDSTWSRILDSDKAQRGIDELPLDAVKSLVTSPSLSPQTRARARALIGDARLREVLESVDSSVGQRALEGARDSEVQSLFGAEEAAHNQKALLVRRSYKDSSRTSKPWVTDMFTNTRERNHYAVLGLPFGANPAQVKFSYRLLAASFHSDRIDNPADKHEADRQLAVINASYSVLSDDNKRAPYDEMIGKNRFDKRPDFLPQKPWYTAPALRTLQLSLPPSSFYTAQPELTMPKVESRKLLGPAGA